MFKHLSRTDKVRKSSSSHENLDLTEKIKGKIDNQVYLVEIGKIQRFYIENRKVQQKPRVRPTALICDSIRSLKFLPTNFIQISQSEIINIDSISHLKLTPNGLVEIFLKNESFTYSSRRYLKPSRRN